MNLRVRVSIPQGSRQPFRRIGIHCDRGLGLRFQSLKEVDVPLCVSYDVEGDQIKRGRVYFELPALMAQLGIAMGPG